MKVIDGVIKHFGELIDDVTKQTISAIQAGRIPSETSITDRFLGTLENEINNHSMITRGIYISASTLLDRGKNSPESQFGADFAIMLDINVVGFSLKKTFLCQAKKTGNFISLDHKSQVTKVSFKFTNEFIRLKEQVSKMLAITPDSFVIIYSETEFAIVPASSISGLTDSGDVYGKLVKNFFKEFLLCFIGDVRISDKPDDWKYLKNSASKIMKININDNEFHEKQNVSPSDLENLNKNKSNLVNPVIS